MTAKKYQVSDIWLVCLTYHVSLICQVCQVLQAFKSVRYFGFVTSVKYVSSSRFISWKNQMKLFIAANNACNYFVQSHWSQTSSKFTGFRAIAVLFISILLDSFDIKNKTLLFRTSKNVFFFRKSVIICLIQDLQCLMFMKKSNNDWLLKL